MTMIRDLVLLTQLEIKRTRHASSYWLRLIGFEPSQGRALGIYVLLFWMVWAYAMWSYVVEHVTQLSASLTHENLTQMMPAIPVAIFVFQVLYLMQVFRDPPLKLAAADLQYVATSPLSRGMITLVNFVSKIILPAIAIGLVGAQVALFFTWRDGAGSAGIVGLQAFLVSFFIAFATAALWWSIALIKQHQPARLIRLLFWLIVPLLVASAVRFPEVFLLPGNGWLTLLSGTTDTSMLIGVVVSFAIGVVVLIVVGNWLWMTKIIADSQTYARIQKLGVLGRFMAADVISRIKRQAQLGRKQVIYRRFPKFLLGTSSLVGQSIVTMIRHSPGAMIRLFFSGGVFVTTALLPIRFGGTPSLPSWMLLYLVLLALRPRDIVRGFQAHGNQSFMRQFISQTNFQMFVASAAVPFTITAAGMLIVIFAQSWINPFMAAILALLVLAILTLCVAVETVDLKKLQLPKIAYEYSLLASEVVIILGGYLGGGFFGASAAAVLVIMVLTMMLAESATL